MDLPLPWLLASIAARTFIVLVVLVVGIRLFGKRGIGELNLIDLTMVLLIGNAVQNALTHGNGHLGVGLISAATLLIMDWGIGNLIGRRPWLERRLLGDPTVLCVHGRLDPRALRRVGVNEEEVRAAMRDQGLTELSDVRLIVLEDDGTISVVPEEHKT